MTIEVKIPAVGESIQEVQIGRWLKHEGDAVQQDETIVELDTDKASMELPAPADGVIGKIVKHDGDAVRVGDVIAYVETDGAKASETRATTAPVGTAQKTTRQSAAPASAQASKSAESPEPPRAVPDEHESATEEPVARGSEPAPVASPSVRRLLREHHLTARDVKPEGDEDRVLREDVVRYLDEQRRSGEGGTRDMEQTAEAPPAAEPAPPPAERFTPPAPTGLTTPGHAGPPAEDEREQIVPMTLVRRRIAERLVEARQKAALLTTFNDIDMGSVIALRSEHGERFRQKYGVKLGFMSFFVKASVDALREFPAVNAEVRGTDMVYRNYCHVGVAIGAARGLVVPVLRHAERLSFGEIEQAIADFARRAEANKLEVQELAGGTFTISNGGIFGSLLSTPIVNPPQSAVLGMHAIQERPVAREGQVVIRPMMYVALTYDHRIIDGREAVSFLKRVKDVIEEPARLAIDV
jgi:2-oxoglutarate dehydrogenase E2 component (dihydrolipoamide succinyltransferase)